MKTRKIYFVILIAISLLTVSFVEKPLSEIDFSNGDYKLYCYVIPGTINSQEFNDFHFENKNFYIDDKSTLEKIKNSIIGEKSDTQKPYGYLYALQLVLNGEIIDGGAIDTDNKEIIYYNGKYKFDLKEFTKFKGNFKRLDSYEVNCVTISNTKHFLKFVENSTGFIFKNYKEEENPLIRFNGKIDLKSDTSNADFRIGWEMFQNKFSSDFSDIGEITILHSDYNGGDSINVTMLWKSDYSSRLPKGYRIINQYTDTLNLPIQVYDISKEKIIDFFKNNGIQGFTIKDLNE